MLNQPILRGCGTRVKGGVYAETLTGPHGHPIEEFLIDPPYSIDPHQLGLTPVGVKLVEVVGQRNPDGTPVHWIWDWVGSSHYPNPADFVEEARRYGASRRLPTNLDWTKITPLSRLVLVHTRAGIRPGPGLDRLKERERALATSTRASDVVDALRCTQIAGRLHCRRAIKDHPDDPEANGCARYLWQTIREGEAIEHADPSLVRRSLGSTEYAAIAEPDPPLDPSDHYLAIFLRLPIHRIAVVKDDAGGKHRLAFEQVERAQVPVDLVGE